MLLAEWQVGQVFWSILWFTLFFIWIWLLILVFSDIFRSKDLGGFSKAIWVIFVILFPYLGVFVYLNARGHKMADHAAADAQAAQAAQADYIRTVVNNAGSPADELAKAADLKDKGLIDDAEFESMKAKILGS